MEKVVNQYLQRLHNGGIYKEVNADKLVIDESTNIDGLAYFLDEIPCSVEDRVEDRDGRYDNSAAFICNVLGEKPDMLVEFTDEDQSYGFLALYARKNQSTVVNNGRVQTTRFPVEEVSVFPYEHQEEVDILIEV